MTALVWQAPIPSPLAGEGQGEGSRKSWPAVGKLPSAKLASNPLLYPPQQGGRGFGCCACFGEDGPGAIRARV